VREFEGTVEAPESLGEIPDVAIDHAAEAVEEARSWELPGDNLLDVVAGKHERLAAEVKNTGATIVGTLNSFGIETRLVGANSGPTVTQYEVQPAAGVSVRK